MLISVLVIIASTVMFLYWFRYTCLLLRNRRSSEYALKVASTIRLSFPQVREALATQSRTMTLDQLHQSLESDHHVLMDLLGQAIGDRESVERRILALDYRVMQSWYKVTRGIHPLQAKKALSEMSSILSCFAAQIGESA